MLLRLCLLGIGLSAALSLPCAAASWTVHPGTVGFTIPPLGVDLGLDLDALSAQLCPRAATGAVKTTASGNCSIGGSIDGGRGVDDIAAAFDHVFELDAGRMNRLPVSVTDFDLLGTAPLLTACGPFDWSVSLDPAAEQPASELLFVVTDYATPAGTFSGILRVHVVLHLTPVGGGHPLDLPVSLDLPIGGPWTLAGGTLVLLARHEDEWRPTPSCLETPHRCGPFCITGSAARIAALNHRKTR